MDKPIIKVKSHTETWIKTTTNCKFIQTNANSTNTPQIFNCHGNKTISLLKTCVKMIMLYIPL